MFTGLSNTLYGTLLASSLLFISSPIFANPAEKSAPLPIQPAPVTSPADTDSLAPSIQLLMRGNQARLVGNIDLAVGIYNKVLASAIETGNLRDVWLSTSNLLSIQSAIRSTRSKELAIAYGKLALSAFNELSGDLPKLYEQSPGLFEENPAQTYQQLGIQLLRSERFDEAEAVLHHLKQRELNELLNVSNQELLDQKLSLRDQELELLLTKNPSAEVVLRSQSDSKPLIKKVFQTAAVQTQARRLLGKGTILENPRVVQLHYFVTDREIGILLKSGQDSHANIVAYPKKKLARQISEFRLAITNRLDTREISSALREILISSVDDLLQQIHPDTLALNLTDRLRYIPFAALQNKAGRYLIQDYGLVNVAPAAGQEIRPYRRITSINGMGLRQARLGLNALPGVQEEMDSIIRSKRNPSGAMPGIVAMDDEFTFARFKQALNGEQRAVHVATHFKFQSGSAKNSLLYLGYGDPVNLQQIGQLDYSAVDLLTLSACDTATGGEVDENGMEVEGLSATVLKAGVRSVLGSLWSVSDKSTGMLMAEFYKQISRGINTPLALQKAQIKLIDTSSENYKHPFFWSSFIINDKT
ncbi:MAG TPA: CHAT domain-containing protein [Limnobacter sp.]|uniref:CHAT domain-containing protein n=1 Tax=Limnobacter sp. TaxID=2003368 RepID=UPI002EDA5057